MAGAMRSAAMAVALTLTMATGAMAQSDVPGPGEQDGVVGTVNTVTGTVTLQDGRVYRAPDTEFVVNGYPTPLDDLRPGNPVTIRRAPAGVYGGGHDAERPGQ